MKKTYKIDVDCANCANKMEEAAKNTAGVKDATVNFMMLKMIVEFEEGQISREGLQHRDMSDGYGYPLIYVLAAVLFYKK